MPTRKARGQAAETTRRRFKTNGPRPPRGLRPDKSRTAAPRSRSPQGDAIALLEADHDKGRGLLSELEKTVSIVGRETSCADSCSFSMARPSSALVPSSRTTIGARSATRPRASMMPWATIEFAAKAKVLKDLVEHHAAEEENEMFPRARTLLDADELARLGERLAKAKQSLTGGVFSKLVGLVGL